MREGNVRDGNRLPVAEEFDRHPAPIAIHGVHDRAFIAVLQALAHRKCETAISSAGIGVSRVTLSNSSIRPVIAHSFLVWIGSDETRNGTARIHLPDDAHERRSPVRRPQRTNDSVLRPPRFGNNLLALALDTERSRRSV